MKTHTASSNHKFTRYLDLKDVSSVALAGPIAFALRDPGFFEGAQFEQAGIYSLIGFASGVVVLTVFHLGRGMQDYMTLREAKTVVKASLATAALTSLFLFWLTRLEFVPRSVPVIHMLVLTALMLGVRVLATNRREFRERPNSRAFENPEHILLVGANRLAWFYVRMVSMFDQGRTDIVAILDDNLNLYGRTLMGYRVLAPPSEIPRVVAEFKLHGIKIDRVVIAANQPGDGSTLWREVESDCRRLNIPLEFLADKLCIDLEREPAEVLRGERCLPPRGQFKVKRCFDFLLSLALLALLSPVIFIIALGVLYRIGWPVVFWQRRDGYGGAPFLIYKFRTLYAPFDRRGHYVEEDRRRSYFGDFLRRTRLDELPQLWNILAGDMSFVGPRPLLPVDQPTTSQSRLQVLPGMTGWAQIHGGKLVNADDKGVLDDWYVANASFWLDIWIILRTISIVILGDKQHPLTSEGLIDPRISTARWTKSPRTLERGEQAS